MTIDFSQWEEAEKDIRKAQKRANSISGIMAASAAELKGLIESRFIAVSSFGGTPWAARKKPAPHPLLNKSGRLKRSVFAKSSAVGNGDHVVTFGASAPYGDFHQGGTSKMPARPFLPLTKSGAVDSNKPLFAAWVNKAQTRIVNFIIKGR